MLHDAPPYPMGVSAHFLPLITLTLPLITLTLVVSRHTLASGAVTARALSAARPCQLSSLVSLKKDLCLNCDSQDAAHRDGESRPELHPQCGHPLAQVG